MSDSNEGQILEELRRISRLLALSLIRDKTSQTEQVEALDRYGFQPKDIAGLLRIKLNIVTATLSQVRKKAKIGKGKRTK